MIIPSGMFAESGEKNSAAQRFPQEDLKKTRHDAEMSRRPKLSKVGHASRGGKGRSKPNWIQTAVGSPGFKETLQIWPASTGLPPNRPSIRREDQFVPESTGSPMPPVGMWYTNKRNGSSIRNLPSRTSDGASIATALDPWEEARPLPAEPIDTAFQFRGLNEGVGNG